MNNENLIMNVVCDTTGSIENKKESQDYADIILGKTSGIYKIINKIDGKYYVGSSKHINNRWRSHKSYLIRNIHTNKHLQNAWNKCSKNMFKFVVIEYNVPFEKLIEIEQRFLDIAKTERQVCYNSCFNAEGRESREFTKETRLKMSNSHLLKYKNGYVAPMTGKYHTKLFKQKRSIQYRGINNPNYGNHKISGKNHVFYNSTIHHFYNKMIDVHEYLPMYDFYKKYNLSQSGTSRLISGKYKSQMGWIIL